MSALDVRTFPLGPLQTNAYLVRAHRDAVRALVIDPGEEAERLLEAMQALAVEAEAILITHCHFDHIGAVAPLAAATGAPVYCPRDERAVLAELERFTLGGFGPFEGYEAEHTLAGGERLELAGLEIEVLATPGHSGGHLTYALAPVAESASHGAAPSGAAPASAAPALFSGDVLFQGSVGRTDLPGAEPATLGRSIAMLLDRFPPETVVYPGHMGATTLGRERQSNPFLQELGGAAAPASG